MEMELRLEREREGEQPHRELAICSVCLTHLRGTNMAQAAASLAHLATLHPVCCLPLSSLLPFPAAHSARCVCLHCVLLCCCFASPASVSIVLIVVPFVVPFVVVVVVAAHARSAALFECMSRIIFKQVFACVNTFRSLRIMLPSPSIPPLSLSLLLCPALTAALCS